MYTHNKIVDSWYKFSMASPDGSKVRVYSDDITSMFANKTCYDEKITLYLRYMYADFETMGYVLCYNQPDRVLLLQHRTLPVTGLESSDIYLLRKFAKEHFKQYRISCGTRPGPDGTTLMYLLRITKAEYLVMVLTGVVTHEV